MSVTVTLVKKSAFDSLSTSTTASLAGKQPVAAALTSWSSISRASGFDTFAATPSGANLALLLTSALPDSKGGTGLTALGTGVSTALGTATNSTGGFVTSPVANANLANPAITIAGTSTSLGSSITLDTIDNGLAANGLIARTAANTRATRTITGTSGQITVTNGDGVSGNPTISLPSTITTADSTAFTLVGGSSGASVELGHGPSGVVTLNRNIVRATENIVVSLGTAEESDQYPTLELRSATNSSGVSPLIRNYAARGSIAAPSAVQAGDYLAAFSAKGYGATGYTQHSNASIELLAFSNFTDASMPTLARVMLAPVGGVLKRPVAKFRPDGSLWVFKDGLELTETQASAVLNGFSPSFMVSRQGGYNDSLISVVSNTVAERGALVLQKAAGTYATPLAVASGTQLGGVIGAGYDGVANQTGGAIIFAVDGAVSSGSVPTSLSFLTGTNGGTRVEALGLASNGYGKFRNRLGIGKDPSFALDIYEPTDNSVRIRLANSGTGSTGADGFEIIQTGTDSSLQVNILQREAAAIAFWTNGTQRVTISSAGDVAQSTTTEATIGGAGSLTTAGGIYAAKKIITGSTLTTASDVAWDLGAITAGAVTLDTANYVLATIGGVAVKLLKAA